MTRAFSRLVTTINGPLLAALAALALSGCGSGSNILSNDNGTSPGASLTPGATASTTSTARLQVAPVIGSPENVARDLQTQLTSAVERKNITVATAANATGEYVARGYVVAARERNGSKISYIWDLTDQSGKRVHRITGEELAPGTGKDPWSAVTPQVVQNIADKTASEIANWMPSKQSSVPMASVTAPTAANYAAANPTVGGAVKPATVASAATAPQQMAAAAPATTTGSIDPSGPITAIVPSVGGAPGDGSTALSTAIQRELTKNGVTLASVPNAQTYKIEGKVAMGQGKDGKQPIKIDWTVIDPTGKKLGTVSQKNEVPQGSLDGTWGRTADAAAAAATQGILKLLPKAKAVN